jgi:hypothetical protein
VTIEQVLATAGAMFDGGSDVSRREIAQEWAGPDFNAAAVAAWVEAGCWDADTASELRAEGFTPSRDQLQYRDAVRARTDPMYDLCNGDIVLSGLSW